MKLFLSSSLRLMCSLALAAHAALPLRAQGGPVEESPVEEAPAEPPAAAAPAAEAPAPEMPPVVSGEEEEAPAAVRRAPSKPAIDTRITVRVKDAPLSSFLSAISAQAKVSFVLGTGVEATKITAFLQNVTVREALDVLLETKGLTYSRIGKTNTFVIKAREGKGPPLTTRIYQLNYVPLVEQPGAGAGAAPAGSPPAGGAPPAGGEAAAGQTAIEKVLQSVMSANGKVTVDARTNSLIVTDVADVFPRVELLIAELDRKVPQVMFEAQIVEIDTDRAQQLGIEWGGPSGELVSFTGPSRLTDWPLRPGIFRGNRLGVFFPPVAAASAASASSDSSASSAGSAASASSESTLPGGITAGVFSMAQVTAILKALVTRSEARFLGKPKILALNNKSATIEITREQAIGTKTVAASVGTSGSTSTTGAERAMTGLILKVTPQVNKEGYITVLVEPEFTDIVGSAVSRELFDTIRRRAVTLVRVKNGQTLVIGGLLQSKETKVTRKVPFLGYIPIIGWLFTSQSNARSNTDLVIFITPTVLSD